MSTPHEKIVYTIKANHLVQIRVGILLLHQGNTRQVDTETRLRKVFTIPHSTLTTALTESHDDPTRSWHSKENRLYQSNISKTTTIEGVSGTDDIRVSGSVTKIAITANLNNSEHVVDVVYNNRGGGGGVSDGGQSPPIPSIGKTLLNTNANLLPITTATDTFNNLKNLVKIDKGSNSASSGSFPSNTSSGYRSKGVGGFKNGAHNTASNFVDSRNSNSRSGAAAGGVSGHFSTGYNKNSVKIRQHDSDVSPRPRRPYQGDSSSSSSRYYNKNSDLLGQSGQSGSVGSGRSSAIELSERGGINSTSGQDGRRPYQTASGGQISSDVNHNRAINSSSGSSYRSQQSSRYENGNASQNQYGNSSSPGFNSKQPYVSRALNESNVNARKPQKEEYSHYRDYDESPRQRYNNSSNSLDRTTSGRFKSTEGNTSHPLSSSRQTGGSDSYDRSSSDRNFHNRTPPHRASNATSYTSQSNVNNSGNSFGTSPPQFSSSTPPPSAGRWVPPSLRPQHGLTQNEKNDAVFRKVRGILNKLTPEKFQELSDDLLQLDLNSIVILNGVILLIFEKALDEPKYSSMYAQLCKRLSEEAPVFEEDSNNSCTFLRLLIAVCRDKFNNRLTKDILESDTNNQFSNVPKVQSEVNPENDTDEEERRHLAKQRMLGNVKFIGELNKLNMLSKNVLHQCIQELLHKKKKRATSSQEMCEDMECLSQLLKTCGKNLDSEQEKELMNQYFDKLERRSKSTEYPPRIRFMLKDVIELRENHWVPRKVTTTERPVPIKQIRTDDDTMIRTPFANRSRDNRNDRDTDSWMNRFHLNLQPGFNDMFGSLSVTGSSPIMSSFPGSSNSNRSYNSQRNNQSNNYNNRYKLNQNGLGSNREDIRNNQHNNRDQNQFGNQMLNSKEMAPRFKRNLMATNQDSVENLQMRPAANSLLFKAASQNNKLPAMLPITTLPSASVNNSHVKEAKELSSNVQYPLLAAPSLHLFNTSRPSSTPSSEYENKPSTSANGAIDQVLKSTSSHPNFSTCSANVDLNAEGSVKKQWASDKKSTVPAAEQPSASFAVKATSSSSNSNKPKKEKLLNKEEILKKSSIYIKENFFYNENIENNDDQNNLQKWSDFTDGFLQLKIPEKCWKDVCVGLVMDVLDKAEEKFFDRAVELLQFLRKESIIKPNLTLEIFKQVMNRMNERETLNRRITTHVACLISKVVRDPSLLKLSEIANLTDNGQHYPILFLILQQLHKSIGKEALEEIFTSNKINLMNSLPEVDRNKNRLVEILDDRNLSFLCPLIKVQTEMLKQLKTEPNPSSFFKWIKANVDQKYYKDPGFITALMTVILKFITQDTTLAEGVDIKKHPEKNVIEKEELMLHKYCVILQTFLQSNIELQLIAVYAMQVFCYNESFPKGLLCRWFKYLYEAEVIEEEPFILWKEEISDKYPGKGTALFQVNTWLTWLEQAESEDDED